MFIKRLAKSTLWALMSLFITICIGIGVVVVYFELQLPDINSLKDAELQTPLRIYTHNGKLIGEYGQERRSPIPITEVPKQLIQAILATEDQRYYEHSGVDPIGLMRAALELVETGTKSQGGSTITMQVARNFFLGSEKTYTRKIKEILLAIKIDSKFSKQKVLELYLNKIYLGSHAYGVAAAAQVYYGKKLDQLTLSEMAMLAGLPKAPSQLNPIVNPIAAKDRRDHVLERMYQHSYITKSQYEHAIRASITASYHGEPIAIDARYIAEMVRDAMVDQYGDQAFTKGYKVYTTISSKDQLAANNSLQKELLAYDQRHGYRGAEDNWEISANITSSQLSLLQTTQKLKKIPTINNLIPALVIHVHDQTVTALLGNGRIITIPWLGLNWAFRYNDNKAWGEKPQQAADIVKLGDLIRVLHQPDDSYTFAQVPQVQGALVALDPKNGALLALVGGFDFYSSPYNRAVQSYRQPGSSFKPFIYAAALDKGYTLASTINDAPIVLSDPSLPSQIWRPQNDDHRFLGFTRLRLALAHSMNLVTIRLLRAITPRYAVHYVSRFGFDPAKQPPTLSLALGTGLITPLEAATGYAVFANGGYKVNPYLIDRISLANGKTIYQAMPKTACTNCANLNYLQDSYPMAPTATAPQVISPQTAFLITSALKSVIQIGTGHAALILKRNDLAGKTGTTQNKVDSWFSGFNANIVASCWVGFDQPQSLYEWGADAGLPMWIDFMGTVLKNTPEINLPEPPGIVTAKIDPKTGLLASSNSTNAIFEIFRKQHVPTQYAPTQEQASPDNASGEGWAAPLF